MGYIVSIDVGYTNMGVIGAFVTESFKLDHIDFVEKIDLSSITHNKIDTGNNNFFMNYSS